MEIEILDSKELKFSAMNDTEVTELSALAYKDRKHKVERFSLNAVKIKKMKIYKSLKNVENYESKNKGLEYEIKESHIGSLKLRKVLQL